MIARNHKITYNGIIYSDGKFLEYENNVEVLACSSHHLRSVDLDRLSKRSYLVYIYRSEYVESSSKQTSTSIGKGTMN